MAITFPLSLANFWDLLPISELAMWPTEQLMGGRTGGGDQLITDIGDRLWTGEVKLGRMTAAEARQVEVLMNLIRQADRPFFVSDIRFPYPAYDPTGALLTGFTPKIRGGSTIALSFKGLPAGYQIRVGDHLSFTYSSSPTRYALHQAAEAVTANGSGDTTEIVLVPPLQPGAVVDTNVLFKGHFCKAIIVPGSMQTGHGRRQIFDGATFKFVQTFR